MKKIMFNDRYGLTQAVLEGRKTMTRRIVSDGILRMAQMEVRDLGGELEERIKEHTPYCYMDKLAIAQAYKQIIAAITPTFASPHTYDGLREKQGWNNKMFVRANLMPHSIRITNIKVERLQDISKEDCLKEGIDEDFADGVMLYWFSVSHKGISWEEYKKRTYELSRHEWHGKPGVYFWDTPQKAFAALIDKVSGQGTWDSNPWVFAYSFKLIK